MLQRRKVADLFDCRVVQRIAVRYIYIYVVGVMGPVSHLAVIQLFCSSRRHVPIHHRPALLPIQHYLPT